jgi:hypothetical protein
MDCSVAKAGLVAGFIFIMGACTINLVTVSLPFTLRTEKSVLLRFSQWRL